jgi:hypothetical protein
MTQFPHPQSARVLPPSFDPYFAVTGVKRRDWSAPVQPQKVKAC